MYQTSPLEIDGQTTMADMKNSKTGAVEKRPVYLNGYNSFGDGSAIEYFGNMGFNALAIEVGINSLILQPGGTHGWTELNRKDDTTAEIVYEKGDKGNSVLKIVSNTDAAPNKYLQFYQNYAVKPNTAYEFGFRVKGKNIKIFYFSCEILHMSEKSKKLPCSCACRRGFYWRKFARDEKAVMLLCPRTEFTAFLYFIIKKIKRQYNMQKKSGV